MTGCVQVVGNESMAGEEMLDDPETEEALAEFDFLVTESGKAAPFPFLSPLNPAFPTCSGAGRAKLCFVGVINPAAHLSSCLLAYSSDGLLWVGVIFHGA